MATTPKKPDTSGSPVKKAATISVMAFAIMNVTTIVSLRGMPSQAEYGLTSIFYYLFAAIVFLIPVSLVAAELASTFPKKGGIFRWVSEAFGPRWGFAAIYFQWQAVVIWFPTVLIFAGVSIAYIWWPESFDAKLAGNKLYMIVVLLGVYWLATLNTFKGMKSSSKLSTLGGLFGTIIPGAILIILAIVYLCMGKPVYLPLDQPFFPDFSNFNNFVLAASIFLFFAGMEQQAVHIEQMKNPTRSYPISILIATVIVIVIFVLCTLAVGIIIPEKDINLTQTLLIAYRDFWASIGLPWMGNIMAIMLAFGVLGQVSAIIAGPSAGLLTVGKAGYLPKSLQKTNQHGIQVPILLFQGAFVTILTFVMTVLPSVQSAYQILGQLATIIYLIMYIIMYIAAIRLRYTQPNKIRPFRIPGGSAGIWIVGILGLFGAIAATIVSFIPPSQISTGSPATYVGILILGTLFFGVIPFIIYAKHKKEWKDPNSDFEPFDFELEGRKPSQVSKWPAGYDPTASK
ncbi:MAG: putative glutamine/gamma-aminobutyrate antiporter GadC [Tannerellaceae bacterium]